MRGPDLAQHSQREPVVVVGRHAGGYRDIEYLSEPGFTLARLLAT